MKMQPRQPAPYNRIHSMPAEVRARPPESSDGSRRIEGTATTISTDRYDERVHPAAVARSIDTFMNNPVMLYAHQASTPIGWWDTVEREGDGIRAKGTLIRNDSLSDRVWNYVQQGAVRGLSIGFNADYRSDGEYVEDEGVFYWGRADGSGEIELLEISVVPIPANTDAQDLQIARSLGLDYSQPWLEDCYEAKAVVASDLPKADESTEWDAVAAEKRVRELAGGPERDDIDWDMYRQAFVWYDAERAEQFGSYKLPIADVIGGELRVVWRAVASAAAAVAGARGGVEIPSADLPEVISTLQGYYRKFDKPWPEELLDGLVDLNEVNWQANELAIYEEARLLRDVRTVKGLAEGIRNIGRCWRKRGRVQSPDYVRRLAEVVGSVTEIADEVKVLQSDAGERRGEDRFATAFRER